MHYWGILFLYVHVWGLGTRLFASPLPDQAVQNLTCMHAPGGSNFTFAPSLYACASQILNRRTDLQPSIDFLSEIHQLCIRSSV